MAIGVLSMTDLVHAIAEETGALTVPAEPATAASPDTGATPGASDA